jgi:hypothetical protein
MVSSPFFVVHDPNTFIFTRNRASNVTRQIAPSLTPYRHVTTSVRYIEDTENGYAAARTEACSVVLVGFVLEFSSPRGIFEGAEIASPCSGIWVLTL